MMKNWIYPAAAAIIVAASVFTLVEQRSWTIEDGYEIKFTSDDPTGVFTAMAVTSCSMKMTWRTPTSK